MEKPALCNKKMPLLSTEAKDLLQHHYFQQNNSLKCGLIDTETDTDVHKESFLHTLNVINMSRIKKCIDKYSTDLPLAQSE